MISTINISNSTKIKLLSFNEEDARLIKQKGWSFSFVYNFSEIRDIYLCLKLRKYTDLEKFTQYCIEDIKLPTVKTLWNKRRILEHLNALKNFDLIDSECSIKKDVFIKSTIGSCISDDDLASFREIYFNYFRFREIFSWFIDINNPQRKKIIDQISEYEIVENSKVIYSFSDTTRFTDSFFYDLKDSPEIYFIDPVGSQDLMRFWDVFLKWGRTLGVIEKINLDNFGVKIYPNKSVSCIYFVQKMKHNFDLLSYLKEKFSTTYVYIPDLVFFMIVDFRLTIETIHTIILDQYKMNKELLSLERTSEIFIKIRDITKRDKIFFPKYNDSYISHLILRT